MNRSGASENIVTYLFISSLMEPTLNKVSIGFKAKLFAEGLVSLVQSSDSFTVQNIFPINDYLPEKIPDCNSIDILIIELYCPSNHDLDYIYQIRSEFPHLRILLISVMPKKEIGIKLLESGISAYLLKSCDCVDFINALKKLTEGKHYYCSEITDTILASNKKKEQREEIDLTDREKEILGMLVSGITNKQIASRLSLSENTIKTHRKNIQAKFGVSNLLGMVRHACGANLVDFNGNGCCFACPVVE